MSFPPSLDLVREFHTTFDQPIHDQPTLDNEAVNQLRIDLLREEVKELNVALFDHDPVAVLDALTDIQYVLDGAYLSLGFHRVKNEALAEVQRSNMSKLGPDGKPIYRRDGKVLKGPNYSPPDFSVVLGKAGLL